MQTMTWIAEYALEQDAPLSSRLARLDAFAVALAASGALRLSILWGTQVHLLVVQAPGEERGATAWLRTEELAHWLHAQAMHQAAARKRRGLEGREAVVYAKGYGYGQHQLPDMSPGGSVRNPGCLFRPLCNGDLS